MEELNTKYVLEELECISGRWESDVIENGNQVSRKILGIFKSEETCDKCLHYLFNKAVEKEAREKYGVFTEEQRKEIEEDHWFKCNFFNKFITREIVSDF